MKMFKVVDYFNGWSSEPMSQTEADHYLENNPAPTARGVEKASAEWRFDHQANMWRWFDTD